MANLNFLENIAKSLGFMIEKVQNGNNIYEYTAETFQNAVVIITFEIENELFDEVGNHIGYFGIDYVYKRIAYYLFKKYEVNAS